MIRKFLLGLTVIGFACADVALAQQTGIKRTPLQKAEFPNGYTTVTAMAEVPAGGSPGRHTQPGLEIGYITSWKAKSVSWSMASRRGI